jgi:hypothetical protein
VFRSIWLDSVRLDLSLSDEPVSNGCTVPIDNDSARSRRFSSRSGPRGWTGLPLWPRRKKHSERCCGHTAGCRLADKRCSRSSPTASGGLHGTAWAERLRARAGAELPVIMPDAVASGHFMEVAPPRRIVFTRGWEGNGFRYHRVTRQRLHRRGWERYLGRLARRATGQDPGPDRYDD